ncbi:MAG: 2Fe-2S iron-sulfur cluster-binding protein [Thiobacillus sp.]|nr:(2Fe-2S)-binding protein [Gammaproteobacteria bacterium]MDO9008247.1 2Fe-2S iron-sulfur cluster-binding protein [Thiobacillus sp.]MDP3216084.1 2Fe-2S iron-sulfur cluster-binding protein [Deltaproteobacteria bacterium]OGU22922.1 MAG: ferredoxin [Hydrogenophilales bacterium RIFOXYD1_FULL_62_11]MBU4499038.1 (2Fe-2S)-binding protein [Gammaproteobacteria bacterium]
MPMLTINPSGTTVPSTEGMSILEAVLAAGVKMPHKCEGKAECGSCHIFVVEGRKTLSKTQRAENERLDAIVGVSSNSRLACQAKLGSENVTVELLD